jgi:uncharacterized protein (TIGR02996 family)
MSEEAAFLQAIRDKIDDDMPRLVYADWLEEQGKPYQVGRAELIRIQCALERLLPNQPQFDELLQRETQLLQAHWKDWFEPIEGLFDIPVESYELVEETPMSSWSGWVNRVLAFFSNSTNPDSKSYQTNRIVGRNAQEGVSLDGASSVIEFEFIRGLIDTLTVDPFFIPDQIQWAKLNEQVPLRGLSLFAGTRLSEWLDHELLTYFKQLTVEASQPVGRDEAILNLLSFAEPIQIVELGLINCIESIDSIDAVARSWLMAKLEKFRWTPREADAVMVFSTSERLANLKVLDLSQSHCASVGLHHLAHSPYLKSLLELNVSHSRIGDTGLRALADSEGLPNLQRLHLSENRLTDGSVQFLARSPIAGQLTELTLHGNPELDESGILAIANSKYFNRLELLIVDEKHRRTDGGKELLARFQSKVVFD